MTQDLTLQEGLYQQIETTESRPGHHLVVYRIRSHGPVFEAVMEPGEPFRRSLEPWAQYQAFRVSSHRNRRLTWTFALKSIDQAHRFTLTIDLGYEVASPQTLIEQRDHDPLFRLREEVQRLVKQRVVSLPWESIKRGGEALTQAVESPDGPRQQHARDEAQIVAKSVGLAVRSIHVDRILSEDEEALEEVTERKLRKERETFLLLMEKRRQASTLKAHDAADGLIDTLSSMLTKAGDNVENFPQMQRAVRDLGRIRQQLEGLMRPTSVSAHQAARSLEGESSLTARLLPTGIQDDDDPLVRFLAEGAPHLRSLKPKHRARLSALVLHIVAEVLHEDHEGALESRQVQLQDLCYLDVDELELDQDQSAFFRRLSETDPQDLRRQLLTES